jgi:ubiquinol-cytochrome c reductase cytochrome b subunit
MAIAFLGYVLAWGQMSFWGGTVISNLLSSVPCLIEWLVGGFYVSNPTLLRFWVFHFLLPFLTIGFVLIHLYYCHYPCSSNPLGYNINNMLSFFPSLIIKDLFGLFILGIGYTLQLFLILFNLSHPDNSLEVNGIVTPLHIIPEWYFLSFYAVLKAIPLKVIGFIIFLTSIFILFLVVEIKNVSTISRLTSYMWINGNLFITHFFTALI